MNVEQARIQMIEQQVRAWNVLDPTVLKVMSDVPREAFVPERYRQLAFADTAIPLPCGQQMMTPTVEGRLLQALEVDVGQRVLEIGTGSGFVTACLVALGANVTSMEIHAELADTAISTLEAQGFGSAQIKTGDAGALKADKEYDLIAVTGALPARNPVFEKALKVGGRLFVIVGQHPVMSALLITRHTENAWTADSLFETSIPMLENVPVPPPFKF